MAKRKQTGIRAKVKFYHWCVSRGIDLKHFDPMRIDFELGKRIFSFYKNPKLTKEKHNYRFSKTQKTDFHNFPNIESIIFEAKI